MYTWRKEWLHLFESPWGIIERFKYANTVTGRDVIHILGEEDSVLHPLRKISRNLVTLKGLNEERMKSILGVSLSEHTDQFYKKFLEPLNDTNGSYLRKNLSFCEDCIEIGYHSLFHQYILLEDCPFHRRRLFTKCPECGDSIPYEIDIGLVRHPFSCRCGKSICKINKPYFFFEIWTKTDSLQVQSQELSFWWDWDSNTQKKFKDIFLVPEISSFRGGKTINYLLSIVHGSNPETKNVSDNMIIKCSVRSSTLGSVLPELPPSKLVINYRTHVEAYPMLKLKWPTSTSMVNELSFWSYLNICMLQIFKSIARHIKKNVLAKHRKCIRIYRKNTLNTCPDTLAYFLWRQEIEFKRAKDLNVWASSCAFQNVLTFELLKLKNWLYIEDDIDIFNNRKLWPIVIWIYSRLFSHYLVERFNGYIKFCKNTFSNKAKYDKITLFGTDKEFVSSEYPVFIIERHFFTLDKQEISIHWFIDYHKV